MPEELALRARAAQIEAAGPYERGPDTEGAAEVLDPAEGEPGDLTGAGHPGARRHGADPAGRGSLAAPARGRGDLVEDPGPDGDRAHSVGERVVELDEHGEGAVRGAFDEVHLPGRQPSAQRLLHQFAREQGGRRHEPGLALTGGRRLGQPHPLDVPVDVEVLVHRPGRASDGQQHVTHPHPQPGNGGGPGAEQFEEGVGARKAVAVRCEDGERAEVHGVRIGLEVPEGQIERCQ